MTEKAFSRNWFRHKSRAAHYFNKGAKISVCGSLHWPNDHGLTRPGPTHYKCNNCVRVLKSRERKERVGMK